MSQLWLQIAPHLPSIQISTLPTLVLPLRRTAPSPHSSPLASKLMVHDLYTHTAHDRGANTAYRYLCISLQHHHHVHSLNYKHQLHHRCSNLTVLIPFQYIQHCPRVWVQFLDQSRHSCSRLLLHHRFMYNYCEFIFSDDIAGTK